MTYLPAIAVFLLMVSIGTSLNCRELLENWQRLSPTIWAKLLLATFIVPPFLALVLGQVLTGMKFDDPPLEGEKNNPMMPVAWNKTYKGKEGQVGRVFTTTMGAATDVASEGLRRLLVNAAYWCVGLEAKIPERANVEIVGEYKPTNMGFGKHIKGVKPADLRIK